MSDTFEALLLQADDQARNGRWQATLDTLTRALRLQPDHAGTLTGLGTCLLQLDRPQDAVPIFEQAAAAAPGSPEAHNNLGVAHACAGEPARAEAAYQRALACDSAHVPAWRNLALLQIQQGRFAEGVPILAALVKADPADVEAVFVLAECYEQGGEHESALMLYRRAVQLQPEHAAARAAVARLSPAARIARPEHARKLAALRSLKKANGAPNLSNSTPSLSRSAGLDKLGPPGVFGGETRPQPAAHLGFFGAAGWQHARRFWAPARWLAGQGQRVRVAPLPEPRDLDAVDIVVIARPHAAPALGQAVARARQAGKRVVIDLDEDFHRLPADHPEHATLGPGNPDALRALEAALAEADVVTVSSDILAARYGAFARQIMVAPDAVDADNALWRKPGPARATANLGWVGTEAELGDLGLIRRELIQLLRQHPRAQLVLAGAPGACALFDAVPDPQLLYLPPLSPEDYPYLLAHFDILLLPLRENAYNAARPARRLLEAGARGLPWVASPLPASQAWESGGLLAGAPVEWSSALRELLESPALRQELGEAGRRRSAAANSGPHLGRAVLLAAQEERL